jgi:hypothetical protein
MDSQGAAWGDLNGDGCLDLVVANLRTQNHLFRSTCSGTFLKGSIGGGTINSYSASLADFDGDGFLDIFFSNGGVWGEPYANDLFRNTGTGDFVRQSLGDAVAEVSYSMTSAFADYDNDGLLDLFVVKASGNGANRYTANPSSNLLFRGTGAASGLTRLSLSDVTIDESGSNFVAFGDYDNDGFPDLFVANGYISNVMKVNHLYRNDGVGGFVKQSLGDITSDVSYSRSAAWHDYDADGHLDLFVANVRGVNHLYKNDGVGAFVKQSLGDITADIADSMHVAFGDYDNDGRHMKGWSPRLLCGRACWLPVADLLAVADCRVFESHTSGAVDLFVANGFNAPGSVNHLYKNNGMGGFVKQSLGDITSDVAPSFGAAFGDYDNDGFLDLFVANMGYFPSMAPNMASLQYSFNHLYRNDGVGGFVKQSPQWILQDYGFSTAAIWADYDNDGHLDLFVTNLGMPNNLYKNDGNGGFVKQSLGDITSDVGKSMGAAWGDLDNDGSYQCSNPRLMLGRRGCCCGSPVVAPIPTWQVQSTSLSPTVTHKPLAKSTAFTGTTARAALTGRVSAMPRRALQTHLM